MSAVLNPVTIEKEEVPALKFPKEEVLNKKEDQIRRTHNLEKAQALGNTEKFKIKVVFEDDQAIKQVETTIWAAGRENIVLKKGVFIPVHRIHEIKLL
jgi:uncharacterized protein (UPF0248 family)